MELENKKINIVEGDERQGYPSLGPYDCIYSASAIDPLFEAMMGQLKNGGRILFPVEGQYPRFRVIDKDLSGNIKYFDILVKNI